MDVRDLIEALNRAVRLMEQGESALAAGVLYGLIEKLEASEGLERA